MIEILNDFSLIVRELLSHSNNDPTHTYTKGAISMIKLTTDNTQRAIERCRELKPRVKFIKDRLHVVYSADTSNVYHVQFDIQNGEKFGVCECKSSKKSLVCYHLIAGATANIYRLYNVDTHVSLVLVTS